MLHFILSYVTLTTEYKKNQKELKKQCPSNNRDRNRITGRQVCLIGGNCNMAISIGINGFGRIGRVALRIAINQPDTFKVCGINVRNADLGYMNLNYSRNSI